MWSTRRAPIVWPTCVSLALCFFFHFRSSKVNVIMMAIILALTQLWEFWIIQCGNKESLYNERYATWKKKKTGKNKKKRLKIDWNMPHKALNRILQLSNKKKERTRMKANSGWVDDVYIFHYGMYFFFSLPRLEPSSLFLKTKQNDKTL